jgi:hypothetical protein
VIDCLPLAHAGHVLIDAAFFLVPVGSIGVMILILNKKGPKDPEH